MKKIFLFTILCVMWCFQISWVFAATEDKQISKIIVNVTENIPGGNCTKITSGTGAWLYQCEVEPGFKSVQKLIGQIIKWFTAITVLAAVLFIVINGIMLIVGGDDTKAVKDRIVGGIVWLILVLLSGVILNMIAPWVYK